MTKLYVYSTLTADNRYVNHRRASNDLPQPVTVDGMEGVLIKGGTGIADKRLVTPRGVATEVTEAQAEYLRENPVFKLHEGNGFVVIDSAKVDPEAVASGMAVDEGSAPLQDGDFGEGSGEAGDEPAASTAGSKPPKAKR
jgi:hypothetical protein